MLVEAEFVVVAVSLAKAGGGRAVEEAGAVGPVGVDDAEVGGYVCCGDGGVVQG